MKKILILGKLEHIIKNTEEKDIIDDLTISMKAYNINLCTEMQAGREITLYIYTFDDNPERNTFYLNEQYATISLTFNAIKIRNGKGPVNKYNIAFSITGLLYKKNNDTQELLNTTSMLHERVPLHQNQTKHIYSLNNPEKWTLIFENIPRNDNT